MDDGTVVETSSVREYERTFTFTYNNGNKQERTLKLQVDISEAQNCMELTSRVAGHHNIPCFVEEELREALQNFIEKERILLYDEQATKLLADFKQKPDEFTKIAKSVSAKYKKSWARFLKTDAVEENEQFSTMYHKLIHSKAMTLLLSLEEHYYHSVQKILKDKQSSMTKLREKQELEMQRTCEHISSGSIYTEDDVNKLALEQSAALQKSLDEWDTKYSKLVHNQRKEYRGVVARLYSEMMLNNGEVDENAQTFIEMKKIVEVSERAKVKRLNTLNDSTSSYNVSPGKKGQR